MMHPAFMFHGNQESITLLQVITQVHAFLVESYERVVWNGNVVCVCVGYSCGTVMSGATVTM